jgi:phosphoglycolate phosphatase
MKDRLVFFDLDGTLTDPRPGIIGCIRYALQRMGERVPEEEALLWAIGPPLKESFARLLSEPARSDEAVALYRERFGEVGLYENAVYPGIHGLLDELSENGMRLAVATSKPHVYANRILEHFDLAGYFEAVFGSELSGERTDKTELLSFALKQLAADNATMVGDRRHDVIGARNCGLFSVGVLYGYGSREELAEAGVDRLVDGVEELSAVLSPSGQNAAGDAEQHRQ